MRVGWWRLLVILITFVVVGGCQTVRPATPPVLSGPQRHVLPNGVRVIVQGHHASDTVAVQLWVKVGGRDEAPSELGLSHYLEHSLFKGTSSRALGFIERDVEAVGGRINAGTSYDYTFYHAVLPARWGLTGIELLADISVNASLDAAELEREKQVVLEEIRRTRDSPRASLTRELNALLFEGHPYGRDLAGTPEIVRELNRETLAKYYRSHYVPEAFSLVVVGAVDPCEVVRTAERAFRNIAGGSRQRQSVPAAPAARSRRLERVRAGTETYLGLAWPAPKLNDPEQVAVDLMSAILGESRSSRLVVSLRDRQHLVSSIRSSYSALEAAGALTIIAQVEPGHLGAAEDQAVLELRRIQDHGVTEAERRRAVIAAETAYLFRTETPEGLARAYGRAETVWQLADELRYLARLRSVTREQIQAAARRFPVDRYVRLAFLPTERP
jgi:zinc protease